MSEWQLGQIQSEIVFLAGLAGGLLAIYRILSKWLAKQIASQTAEFKDRIDKFELLYFENQIRNTLYGIEASGVGSRDQFMMLDYYYSKYIDFGGDDGYEKRIHDARRMYLHEV